jgi:hypothetical protein
MGCRWRSLTQKMPQKKLRRPPAAGDELPQQILDRPFF